MHFLSANSSREHLKTSWTRLSIQNQINQNTSESSPNHDLSRRGLANTLNFWSHNSDESHLTPLRTTAKKQDSPINNDDFSYAGPIVGSITIIWRSLLVSAGVGDIRIAPVVILGTGGTRDWWWHSRCLRLDEELIGLLGDGFIFRNMEGR